MSKVVEACPNCNYTGNVTCNHCQGTGTNYSLPCKGCNGTGKIKCTPCQGSGTVLKEERVCIITTATLLFLSKSDDCYELGIFRKFRDNYVLKNYPHAIEEYYHMSPKIVAGINKQPNSIELYMSIWNDYLQKAFDAILTNQNEVAYKIYDSTIKKLEQLYT